MNKTLTLGSLFDGSGGFPLGGLLSGITPLWASEIEPFPIRVTTKRLPTMKHYGDVSTLNGAELPPVDIITFGSPCQDMSLAGKRTGLNGNRSSLFYQAIRIIKEMRQKTNEKYPRFIVWENVPGAFSSNKGEDFKTVLEEICKIKDENTSVPRPKKWENAGTIVADGFSLAWRVLNAQYWGVPQRRKRIYLVADFASECARKILFESEGLSRYSAESFQTWQGTTRDSASCAGKTSTICLNDQGGVRMDVTEDKTSTLRAGVVPATVTVFENHSQDTRYTVTLDVAPTINAGYGTGGNNQPFVVETPKTLKIRSGCEGGDKGALSASMSSKQWLGNQEAFSGDYHIVEPDYIVRRLTPTECARLQGFPVWWCDDLGTENPTDEEVDFWKEVFETHRKLITGAKKSKTNKQIRKWLQNPHSDSAEYKMWGNGVALPNVYFVLAGIVWLAEQNINN